MSGSDEFQKNQDIFFGKSCSRDFGAPDCYPSTLIDLANTALASRDSVETICHMHDLLGLQNPSRCHWSDEFQKIRPFFSETRAPGVLGPLAAI